MINERSWLTVGYQPITKLLIPGRLRVSITDRVTVVWQVSWHYSEGRLDVADEDTSATMDMHDMQDCQSSIERIRQLLGCGIFHPARSQHVLHDSAFTELMICLRDLLHKSEKYARRIDFTDDVLTNKYVNDVTDAVTAMRDACCHINSFKRVFDDHGNRGFMVGYGKCDLYEGQGVHYTADYEDDTAFFFGSNRLYLNRHIIRTFNEAVALLTPLLRPKAPPSRSVIL